MENLFKKYTLDKDICVELVKYMKSKPEYKKRIILILNVIVGDGEW